jgi:hypothetical protein
MKDHRRSRCCSDAGLAVTTSLSVPIWTTARGVCCRLSDQSGGRSAPPFDAITTRSVPSRKNVSGVVRAFPDRRPVVVSRSTGIPATEPRRRPLVMRRTAKCALPRALIAQRRNLNRTADTMCAPSSRPCSEPVAPPPFNLPQHHPSQLESEVVTYSDAGQDQGAIIRSCPRSVIRPVRDARACGVLRRARREIEDRASNSGLVSHRGAMWRAGRARRGA